MDYFSKFNIQHPTSNIQKVDPEALDHIRTLAAEHNSDLPQWCARRRRYEAVRRTVVAACIFVGCCMSYSSVTAAPLYGQITTTGNADNQHICETIRLALDNA